MFLSYRIATSYILYVSTRSHPSPISLTSNVFLSYRIATSYMLYVSTRSHPSPISLTSNVFLFTRIATSYMLYVSKRSYPLPISQTSNVFLSYRIAPLRKITSFSTASAQLTKLRRSFVKASGIGTCVFSCRNAAFTQS